MSNCQSWFDVEHTDKGTWIHYNGFRYRLCNVRPSASGYVELGSRDWFDPSPRCLELSIYHDPAPKPVAPKRKRRMTDLGLRRPK